MQRFEELTCVDSCSDKGEKKNKTTRRPQVTDRHTSAISTKMETVRRLHLRDVTTLETHYASCTMKCQPSGSHEQVALSTVLLLYSWSVCGTLNSSELTATNSSAITEMNYTGCRCKKSYCNARYYPVSSYNARYYTVSRYNARYYTVSCSNARY